MGKFISLLKATMSGDMNIFKVSLKNDKNQVSSKFKNFIIVCFLLCILMYASGNYAYLMAEPLKSVGCTYLILSIFTIVTSIIVFMEGVYKSQSILFDAKDNDLLFSMPINKKVILASRMIKLLVFQYIFDLIVMVPALAVYAYLERPGINFYISSVIFLILIPIIPTIISSIIGFIIKSISSVFKNKKIAQLILSLVCTLGILYASFEMQNIFNSLAQNANNINEGINKIYYPVQIYLSSINKIDIIQLAKLILINIVPAIVFMYLFSISYFNIIAKSSEISSKGRYKLKNNFKVSSKLKALTKKEFKRFFSSPTYVINTIFGLVLVLIVSIGVSINLEGTLNIILKGTEGVSEISQQFISIVPICYIIMILIIVPTVAITASSISLEGKSINITKTLPVETKTIFKAKIIVGSIFSIITFLITSCILFVRFKFELINIIQTIAICIIAPVLNSILGLIINLKFPNFETKNEAMVVKQSTSAMLSIFGGMVFFMLPTIAYMVFELSFNIKYYISIMTIIYMCLTILLWNILIKYGSNKFRNL